MTSPSTSATSTSVANSGNLNIDALVSGYKWGGAVGTPASVSYSFPWINGLTAVFSGPSGQVYSTEGEPNANQHFGLNTIEQGAAVLALTAWSNVANINFTQITENNSSVGDIRFAFSSAASLTNWWGYAGYPSSYWPSAGDVWINSKYGSDTDWSIGSYNFEALMHEIGKRCAKTH